VAQVVECLSSKHKALSSNSSIAKKRKNQKYIKWNENEQTTYQNSGMQLTQC
jgi:hypothetical protein